MRESKPWQHQVLWLLWHGQESGHQQEKGLWPVRPTELHRKPRNFLLHLYFSFCSQFACQKFSFLGAGGIRGEKIKYKMFLFHKISCLNKYCNVTTPNHNITLHTTMSVCPRLHLTQRKSNALTFLFVHVYISPNVNRMLCSGIDTKFIHDSLDKTIFP